MVDTNNQESRKYNITSDEDMNDNFWINGKTQEAMKINFLISNLNKSLFLETSPAPVKYALSLMKKCENELRLPLVGINFETKKNIEIELKKLKIL